MLQEMRNAKKKKSKGNSKIADDDGGVTRKRIALLSFLLLPLGASKQKKLLAQMLAFSLWKVGFLFRISLLSRETISIGVAGGGGSVIKGNHSAIIIIYAIFHNRRLNAMESDLAQSGW